MPFCRGRGDAVLYFMEEWLYLCTLLQKALERGWREEENVDVNVMHPSDSQISAWAFCVARSLEWACEGLRVRMSKSMIPTLFRTDDTHRTVDRADVKGTGPDSHVVRRQALLHPSQRL